MTADLKPSLCLKQQFYIILQPKIFSLLNQDFMTEKTEMGKKW